MWNALDEIQELLAEIRGLNDEIKQFESLLKISTGDLHERRAYQLLNQRMALLLDRLERLAEGNDEV
jgi:hypothetical protein